MSVDPYLDALHQPRGRDGLAPDVFSHAGWVPMRSYPTNETVDFAIVGTGAGGATLAAKLAEAGFSVVAFDAGAWWRPLSEFASDEGHQEKLFWMDERICDGDNPLVLGTNNSGRAVGGSTVHYAMIALRFRPEWFKARSQLGYGVDWPLDWQEMWHYYREAETAINLAGPINYPWGPQRPRYPYRAHEVNASGIALAQACEALGVDWAPAPLATLSAPGGQSPPCVYRGFCVTGCSTNAKQSSLVTWIPRALRAGAEVRDLAMVGRIETTADGRASGLHYHREGAWHFQPARQVIVAGYAIETPRLLLNSATQRFPDGLANSSGLLGRNLMVHTNQAVWGQVQDEIRWYKGPPSTTVCEHWNYEDRGKDFFGGYAFMNQGPLPGAWAQAQVGNRGLWGQALVDEMQHYNHQVGLKIVGETLPQTRNRVTLDEQTDQYGLPIARVSYSFCDNDNRLVAHALNFLGQGLEAIGASDIWSESDGTAHLMGTARMGFSPADSVVDADCRSWDIPNLWICDGSVFPTSGGVNPSLTIQAIACRTADRIVALARRGELA